MIARDTPPIVLLGPQRAVVTAGDVMESLVPDGQVATVTAGWQEREGEIEELNTVLGARTCNLALYRRAERAWKTDPELRRAHRTLQQRLRLLRQSYILQLNHLMDAWLDMRAMDGDATVLDPERRGALEAIQRLDQRHLARMKELRATFDDEMQPTQREALAREAEEIRHDLDQSSAVAIAGGHVVVLMNRLRMFGLGPLLAHKPIVAWSAGAMAMSDRVVAFHDSPPQGAGHAEALDVGLGIAPQVVVLPHAGERLRLGDADRVSRIARRFAPDLCVPLDAAEGVERSDGEWTPIPISSVRGARYLAPDGFVRELSA